MRFLNLLSVCLACAVLSSPHGSLFAMADCITYTVVSGDTCYAIAQAHLITVSVFEEWNAGIVCSNLQIGQEVCVTDPNSTPATGPCNSYTVKAGDICWAIWTQYGLTQEEFRSYNPGINCNTLQIGQEVCVSSPGSAPPSPPPPPFAPPPPPPPPSEYNGNVFTEYIGANWVGVQFTDVPINSGVDFYFILSFAIDYTSAAVAMNGDFLAYWQYTILTPDAVTAIKAQNSNVKVMLSLGGDTVSGEPVIFTPTSTSSWVSNAVSSLTSLINQYGLDGIDIDYEHFASSATPEVFADCIGQLITELKENNVISVATIAPYALVESYYVELFNQYSSVIDYVNYQFYAYASASESQYVSYYDAAASKFGGGSKVLASFNTAGIGTSPTTVLSACEQLQATGRLPGIFVWSADNSISAQNNFTYEEQAQSLLASSSYSSQLSLC